MTLSIIVATDLNGLIGKDNTLPWHLPADLKYFKETTTGKTVIMGRKTFESIGRPLPNRKNIVISKSGFHHEGVEVFKSLEEATDNNPNAFLIGGSQLYKYAMDNHLVTDLYHTQIVHEFEPGDAYFYLNLKDWDIISYKENKKDEKNNYNYNYIVYKKRKV